MSAQDEIEAEAQRFQEAMLLQKKLTVQRDELAKKLRTMHTHHENQQTLSTQMKGFCTNASKFSTSQVLLSFLLGLVLSYVCLKLN